ncbi:MAG: hypothetical protein C5B51_24950 [Terriglobia bacterium]|nr:MAG: hypothetical protein C5B51_24950 [Terriglobia bacterium]
MWRKAAAFLFAAFQLHAQSAADEANKELPKWLRVGGEYRARYEAILDRSFVPGQDDAYFLNRLRVNLQIRPVSWMKFVFQGQDVRIFFNQKVPDAPPNFNPMDLRLGYVELGDSEHGTAALRAGRQEIAFGDLRLLGPTNWTNQARSFDAVRVTLRHLGYRLDLFSSSVVVPSTTAFDRPQAGNNLHGLYGGIEKLVPGAVIEPYLLWRVAPHIDFKTIGARWVGKIHGGIDYGVEMAGETGTVHAWAGHWVAGYRLANHAWKPRWSAEYNYASGDRDPHDGRIETFDQLYPTAHDKYGVTDLVGWRNIHDVRFGCEVKPTPKLLVWSNYHNWWLASARDALYSGNSAVLAVSADGSAGRHVGQEIDLQGVYTLTKQTQAGVGVGHIFPGGFLKHATPGRAYTYPYLMLNYTF